MHPCEPSQLEELTEKLLGFFKGAAPKNPAYTFVPEIEMIRPNSPPDERDADATEQDSDGDIEARRSPLVNDKANQEKPSHVRKSSLA